MNENDLESTDVFERAVDGLAEQGYSVLQGFIGPRQVTELQNAIFDFKQDGELRIAGIGKQLDYQKNQQVRGDLIRWVDQQDPHPAVQNYLETMWSLMRYLNRYLFLGLKDFELHYTSYPPGTFYKRHSDRFNRTAHRVISAVLYLNTDWKEEDGGQLIIYLDEDKREVVAPRGGTLVLFKSELEHEVLPTRTTRYSITGWMLDQLTGLTFLK